MLWQFLALIAKISATAFIVGVAMAAATATNATKDTAESTSQATFVLMNRRFGIDFVFTICLLPLSSFQV